MLDFLNKMSENIDYRKLIKPIDEKKEKDYESKIEQDLGNAVNTLTNAIVNTTQFSLPQLTIFSLLKNHRAFAPEIREIELHLKDISRKNAKELIEFVDKVSRMIRLNSIPDLNLLENFDLNESFHKKRRFRK